MYAQDASPQNTSGQLEGFAGIGLRRYVARAPWPLRLVLTTISRREHPYGTQPAQLR